MLMLSAFRSDPRVQLVAACAPREESRNAFTAEFGGRAYSDVDALCADTDVEAVYIATPHQMHRDHVISAARAGKHVLVDKPLAVSMDDGRAMVEACRDAGVALLVGPSHSFDGPVGQARAMIDDGVIGHVRMIQAFNYTDFLYRPRRPEELVTAEGGGVIFSQGVHQIDIVRLLAGGGGERVFAMTGAWDPNRPTEGAYSALVSFEGGVFASLTYSGYAHFDSDEWMDWVGELGTAKSADSYGGARKALAGIKSAADESALKSTRTYSADVKTPSPNDHEHFGPIIVCGERGDLRLTPRGIHFYGDTERTFVDAPPLVHPRKEVVDALVACVRDGKMPAQTGQWGLASLEICHAIFASAEKGEAVGLEHQVKVSGEGVINDRS
ncbi:Gfo/Idh/MocA family oxidoreductase [Amorphus sp. 3PC139-8]